MSETIMVVIQPQNPAISAEITFKAPKEMLFSKIAYAFSKRNNFPPGTIRFVIPDGEGGAKLQDDMTIENILDKYSPEMDRDEEDRMRFTIEAFVEMIGGC